MLLLVTLWGPVCVTIWWVCCSTIVLLFNFDETGKRIALQLILDTKQWFSPAYPDIATKLLYNVACVIIVYEQNAPVRVTKKW